MYSSYKKEDVTILLKDISGLIIPLDNMERERQIQSGVHYSKMLPLEYKPSPDYMKVYEEALVDNAYITAKSVAVLSSKLLKEKDNAPVLVSLARAGTSIGVLIKRYIKYKYGIDVAHYTISIIRGRGIDKNAMKHILERHPAESLQFIDGWIGKGAIQRELMAAVEEFEGLSPKLAVLSDPAYITELCGSHKDFLIASSCLNSTVSGLLSRTVLREDIIGDDDFHGAVFYKNLLEEDRTYEFIESIESYFDKIDDMDEEGLESFPDEDKSLEISLEVYKDIALHPKGLQEAMQIQKDFDINDINFIKPGIGETTRVLLRRVPWKILVSSLDDESLRQIYQLAVERQVELVIYPLKCYKACGIIKDMSDV